MAAQHEAIWPVFAVGFPRPVNHHWFLFCFHLGRVGLVCAAGRVILPAGHSRIDAEEAQVHVSHRVKAI